MKLFPGQVEASIFTLDHIKALASPMRSEVFWAFTSNKPVSVADVAKTLGKSAQTVHYHVSELVNIGLLIAVDERKKRSRTEKLYVRASRTVMSEDKDTASAEYLDYALKGFAAIMRTLVRETEGLDQVAKHDPDFMSHAIFRLATVRLKKEAANEMRAKLQAVIDEAVRLETAEEGVLSHVVVCLRPTVGESRKRIPKK